MKCELFIELDEDEPVYRPGEMVSGTLRVVTDGLVECNGLDVSLDWYTDGRGNATGSSAANQRLFAGDLPAGERKFRFELEAPSEPRAYHGELLNIDFAVTAAIDVPWTHAATSSMFDAAARVEIAVHEDRDVRYVVAPIARERGNGPGCLIASILLLLGGAFAAFLAATQDIEIAGQLGWGSIITGLLGLALLLPRWLVERKTGSITMNLVQGGAGGYREIDDPRRLRCEIQLDRPSAQINSVTAKLYIVEMVTRGSPSKRSALEHEVYSSTGEVDGSEERHSVILQLPSWGEAPFPFRATHNEVEWYVEVLVDVEGWADWKGRFELDVTPGRSR